MELITHMLDIELLKLDYAVAYGSVTLTSLQNDAVPELDLLVREAIQNSSDASILESGGKYQVLFRTGSFCPTVLNSYLTDITSALNSRYPDETAEFLEIRDLGTSGLTGKTRKSEIKSDDHGNFFKLIYDTGKKQTQMNAGGNHGLGKSVYYRVGIGIVIFYSRIKSDAGYESRLIITLVEDENKKNADGTDATILNSVDPNSAGKAWWGIRDGEDLLPLTNEEDILPILSVFGLKPFGEKETGTSVIIPYLRSTDLLEQITPIDAEIEDGVRDYFKSVYLTSVANYLKLSIQKWYAPKIHNRILAEMNWGKWLYVAVNDVAIRKDELLPFFGLIQELYTTALAKTYGEDYCSELYPQIRALPVNIRQSFDGGMTSGHVAVIKISKSELNGENNYLSPYDYIEKYETDGFNEPLLMYTRDLGMVINYETSGPWTKGIEAPDDRDTYLFAFYMPNTGKYLRADISTPRYAGIPLGEYLRDCEASDHMGWADPVGMQIVTRIQKNVVNQIKAQFTAATNTDIHANVSKLSNRLGRCLLPQMGYEKRKSARGEIGEGAGGKSNNVAFELTGIRRFGNTVCVDFDLKLMHSKKDATITLKVMSESGWLDAKSWREDNPKPFPDIITSCSIHSVATGAAPAARNVNVACDIQSPRSMDNVFEIILIEDSEYKTDTSIHITSSTLNLHLMGTISIVTTDKTNRFDFRYE